MAKLESRFGPLTIGTVLGACIGATVALFGLDAIHDGIVQRSFDSVLFFAFGAAVLGTTYGIIAESLIRHPALAAKRWLRHVIRPITFCTVPYLLIAMSLSYYGYDRLMGGLGLWLCVVVLPGLGLAIAWRRKVDSAFDRRFHQAPTDADEAR